MIMRKASLLAVIFLMASGWVLAQSDSGQSTSSGHEKSITGCLMGSGGSYTLTDDSGKTYQLQGADSKLKPEVGHVIKVRGMETETSSDTGTSANPSGSSTAGGTSFQVRSVSRVSDSCTGVTPK
jgi:hypothetical protein